MKTGNKVALGLASGMLVGAVAGMLLAPKGGKETRHLIVSQASKLRRRIRKSGNGTEESVDNYAGISG